ncbi:S1C family serine protease [Pasteuria penetrans]|uniref:S1C family serine protease n=1 Tax=Pasteuria penetrans TaxID=86005 RepID=UPI000FBC0ACB|nr:trypsin-like peptidase domain-containing protein [Pasteuria penetrans]
MGFYTNQSPRNNHRPRLILYLLISSLSGSLVTLILWNGITGSSKDRVLSTVDSTTPSPVSGKTATGGSIPQAIQKAKPYVVGIVRDGLSIERLHPFSSIEGAKRSKSIGSGIIVRLKENGEAIILTNHHVVDEAQHIAVFTLSGKGGSIKIPASLVGSDEDTDLAVIKVKFPNIEGLGSATFTDSDSLVEGESVVAIGIPLGIGQAYSAGIISRLPRGSNATSLPITTNLQGQDSLIDDLIQTDAAINSGNSGGPLIDSKGQVVGINSIKLSSNGSMGSIAIEGIGFAIPSKLVKKVAEDLMQYGRFRRGHLGVTLGSIPDINSTYNVPDGIHRGCILTGVSPGQAAEKHGMHEGDIITHVQKGEASRKVDFPQDLRSFLNHHGRAGEEITIRYYPQGKTELKSKKIVLGDVPPQEPKKIRREPW